MRQALKSILLMLKSINTEKRRRWVRPAHKLPGLQQEVHVDVHCMSTSDGHTQAPTD